MKYTFLTDLYPDYLMSEDKDFENDEQALAHARRLFAHCNAPSITVIDGGGNKIGEID
ncbi:MAG: hypothetical protein J6M41_08820 [Prevotella sp.]|nr:hypothetical protein [Prevotella sp.]